MDLTFKDRQIPQVQKIPDQAVIVKDLLGLIEEHYHRRRRPAYYAAALAVNIAGLNRLSRRVLGKTVYELIQQKRHDQAMSLLLTTDWSVKRIAYEIGCDPCYFNRCFKQQTGFSPRQFRMAALRWDELLDAAGGQEHGLLIDGMS